MQKIEQEKTLATMPYYDIKNLRRYLVLYHDIDVSIYCPALVGSGRPFSSQTLQCTVDPTTLISFSSPRPKPATHPLVGLRCLTLLFVSSRVYSEQMQGSEMCLNGQISHDCLCESVEANLKALL